MKKKAMIILKSVLSTLFTIILFFFLLKLAVSIFSINPDFENTEMEKLDEVLTEFEEGSKSFDTVIIKMEKKGMFYFFEKDADVVSVKDKIAGGLNNYDIQISRPTECEDGKDCFCYCSEFDFEKKGLVTSRRYCEGNQICNSYNLGIQIGEKSEDFFGRKVDTRPKFEGGFIHSKILDHFTPDYRTRFAIQKLNGEVHFCVREEGSCVDFSAPQTTS